MRGPVMIAVDYFLRDNRTWLPDTGRDWGIKAATGVLAARDDLRAAFSRYCSVLSGDYGPLTGFRQALGGIRSPAGDGYLLCVTLETSDSFGRPSWAAYGLWCPGSIVETVVACDPVGAARKVLGAEKPPPAIRLGSPDREIRASSPHKRLRRFDNRTTAEVIAILSEAARRNAVLPNILGITATSRLSDLRKSFDIIYCHPLDDGAAR